MCEKKLEGIGNKILSSDLAYAIKGFSSILSEKVKTCIEKGKAVEGFDVNKK